MIRTNLVYLQEFEWTELLFTCSYTFCISLAVFIYLTLIFCTGSAVRNVGYVMVVIEIVGRNHAPEFPNCDDYSNIARAPENIKDALVVQV